MFDGEEPRALERSVQDALETMCFSEAERVAKEFPIMDALGAMVEFHGTVAGHLHLEVQTSAAKWLAAAFLGLDDRSVQIRTAEETVRELGNVICGRFLSLLHPQANLTIEPPHLISKKRAGGCWQQFRSQAGLLRVAVHWTSKGVPSSR